MWENLRVILEARHFSDVSFTICLNNEPIGNINYIDEMKNDNNYSVKFINLDEYDDYENYYETIKYCPFCGKPIEIEIVNIVDKTEEFKQLQNERNVLWNKYCKADSKKKKELLKKQVKDLDDKINEMIRTDDFQEEE